MQHPCVSTAALKVLDFILLFINSRFSGPFIPKRYVVKVLDLLSGFPPSFCNQEINLGIPCKIINVDNVVCRTFMG